MVFMGTSAFAQQGEISIGGNITYGFDAKKLGIGPKFQYRIDENWRGEASLNYFFKKDDVTAWDANANIHYLIPLPHEFTLYPLGGLTYYHVSTEVEAIVDEHHTTISSSDGKLGLNLGCGIEYPITEKFKATGEMKYQYINKSDQPVISIGLTWRL